MEQITGIHHVTAIAGEPQKNLDFYSGILGLRLVKLTVNYDDPGTYHLYYGDYSGNPGTLLTFFPWRGMPRGKAGAGQVTVTSFAVPGGSLNYWTRKLRENGVEPTSIVRFDEEAITFQDYDGMAIELISSKQPDARTGWVGGPIPDEAAIRGFHSATLATSRLDASAKLLTATMGFRKTEQDGKRHRFETGAGGAHSIVDLVETAHADQGRQGAGSVHHIAWRVPTDEQQRTWREKLVSRGLGVSPVTDRKYFHSIYYREPNGILFEIATDLPGFTVDEPLESLGETLVLPPWLERDREELVGSLPQLHLPELPHV